MCMCMYLHKYTKVKVYVPVCVVLCVCTPIEELHEYVFVRTDRPVACIWIYGQDAWLHL